MLLDVYYDLLRCQFYLRVTNLFNVTTFMAGAIFNLSQSQNNIPWDASVMF